MLFRGDLQGEPKPAGRMGQGRFLELVYVLLAHAKQNLPRRRARPVSLSRCLRITEDKGDSQGQARTQEQSSARSRSRGTCAQISRCRFCTHCAIFAPKTLEGPPTLTEENRSLVWTCMDTRLIMNTVQGPLEPYVDAAAAAQFVGMHPKTLERLARKGVVPGYPIGEGNRRRRWRFLVSELDIWLRARRGQIR